MTDETVVTQNERALAQYGNTADIKLLAERIKYMMPGNKKYTDSDALMLAQLSLAHGLNPFNGETWLIIDNSGRSLGALIGIKGLRKQAKRQSNYWGVGKNGGFRRILLEEELAEYGATPDDVCCVYTICDDHTQGKWIEGLKELRAAGFDQDDAHAMMGEMPTTYGVGIYKKGERTKMKPIQAAMFRAEKDALKRRFDVQFDVMLPATPSESLDQTLISDERNRYPATIYDQAERMDLEFDNGAAEVLDAEFDDDLEAPKSNGDHPGKVVGKETNPTIAVVYDGDRPYKPEVLKANLAEWAKMYKAPCTDDHRKMLASVLNTVFEGDEESRYELCAHLTGHASTKDIPDAYIQAMLKTWAEISGWNQPPSELMIQESHSLLTYLRKEAGQQELIKEE